MNIRVQITLTKLGVYEHTWMNVNASELFHQEIPIYALMRYIGISVRFWNIIEPSHR